MHNSFFPLSKLLCCLVGPIVQYGHGLFGDQSEVTTSVVVEEANKFGWVMCASDWLGVSSAVGRDAIFVFIKPTML